jgi:adenylate kinase family enzyme
MNSYIFIGRSGCGKGTQAELLKKYLEEKGRSLLYIETGDEFRHYITGSNYSNQRSNEAYQRDERQPDFLACYMWTKVLSQEFKGSEDVMFDGTPRSLLEAKVLETAIDFFHFDTRFIINLDVSKDWSRERLLARGRSDDATLTKIDKRLAWYEKDALPAVEYFKDSPAFQFCNINGEQTVELVHADIVACIEPHLS